MADKKKKTNNTEEEIEAALAAATGSPLRPPTPPKRKVEKAELELCKEPAETRNEGWGEMPEEPSNENETSEELKGEKDDASPIAMSYEDFGRKCFGLDINAKMCHYQSSKCKDSTIDEYLRGINKKIYDETRSGGYSTNIQFRVAPNDYVNVNHIIDWYKSRGFQILNYNMGTTHYGANAGMIEYSFTISWAEA